jgi:Peptidase family M50
VKKRDIILISVAIILFLAEAWIANRVGAYSYRNSAQLAVSGYFILYLDGLIHECGHAFAGKIFGARLGAFRLGVGPKFFSVASARACGAEFSLHVLPVGGRVDFNVLPVSRTQRIWIFAAGVCSVLVAAVFAWFIMPARFEWLGNEAMLIFVVSSATNILYSTSKKVKEDGVYSDGQAIRGLLRYR